MLGQDDGGARGSSYTQLGWQNVILLNASRVWIELGQLRSIHIYFWDWGGKISAGMRQRVSEIEGKVYYKHRESICECY